MGKVSTEMAFVGNFILRLITIGFGFCLAILAAGIFVGFGFYNEILTTGSLINQWEEELYSVISLGIGFASTILIGIYSLAVAAIIIAIAELMRWKGMVTNLIMGGGCAGFLALNNQGLVQRPDEIPAFDSNYGSLLVALSAGFIGGFVYWLIAGRRAGDWLGLSLGR